MEEYNLSPNVDRDYIEVNLDLHDKTSTSDVQNYYILKQGDHISRVLRCNLTKGGLIPIDLKNSVLTLYIKKADMGLVAIKGTVVDAINGIVDFPLTRQSLAIADKIICEVVKIGSDASTMSFPLFTLQVEDTIVDEELVESTDEFNLLNDALASVSDCENRLNTQYNEFDVKFDNKYSEIETQFNDKYTNVTNQFDSKYTEISNQFETKYSGLEQEYAIELTNVKNGLSEWWIPTTQKPHSNINFQEVIDTYYEPLRSKFSEITREEIGKDQSGLYPFYLYKFEPLGYEKTIILSAGVHPDEVHGYISLANFINEVYNNWKSSPSLSYIRWKVRIICMPFMNPWGGMQMPLSKVNSRNVEINRNYGFRWRLNDQVYQGTKGTSAFSEAETRHIRTVIDRYYKEAIFWCDIHTSAPNGAYGDKWLDVAISNELMYEESNGIVNRVCKYFRDKYKCNSNTFSNLYSNSQNWGRYARNLHTFVPEFNHNGFGDERYGSEAMTYALEWYGNLIIQHTISNLTPSKLCYGITNPIIADLLIQDGLNDLTDYDVNASGIYSMYDKLMAKYPNYITKNVLATSTGNNGDIYEYIFAPPSYDKTVLINSNTSGKEIKAMLTTYNALKILCENYEINHGLTDARYNTRFIVVPVTNVYGLNYGSIREDRINTNSQNQLIGDFKTENNEHSALKNLFNRYTFDFVIDVMGTERGFGFSSGDKPYKVVKSASNVKIRTLYTYMNHMRVLYDFKYDIVIKSAEYTDNLISQGALKNVMGITLLIQDNPSYFSPTNKIFDRHVMSRNTEFILNSIAGLANV